MPASPLDQFLRSCARVHPGEFELARIRDAISQVQDWDTLSEQAETHGLGPLVYTNTRAAGTALPRSVNAAMRALTARHRLALEIRRRALIEALEMLGQRGIDALVLKGAALAHMIYPTPGLRPMRDLDLLVRIDQADAAQAGLRDIGFTAPRQHSGPMRNHHHLPSATRTQEGLMVSIEIHTDALSGDIPGCIRVDTLADPPRRFDLAGTAARTLGHTDMLRHLCHHTFEPAAETRLISVADIYGYAECYAEQIPWRTLAHQCPFVINTLRCLHYLVPLPASIAGLVTVPTAPPPNGVGAGMRPLSEILKRGLGPIPAYRELFRPPDWWLHVAYSVPPGERLTAVHWLRHPGRLLYWVFRRLAAVARR